MPYQPYEHFNYQPDGPVQGNDYGANTAYQFANSAETQAACKFLPRYIPEKNKKNENVQTKSENEFKKN